ncbi:MAG: hypothetical protein KQH63_10070 [Desulfobulbaceae bacterium]|nr:hypothetical protein [Desulfobulbaceae bacterium]
MKRLKRYVPQAAGFIFLLASTSSAPSAMAMQEKQGNEINLASGSCLLCHQDVLSRNDRVSIELGWPSSVMAHAIRDPVWKAQLTSELARNPQLSKLINKKCRECHAPIDNAEDAFNSDFAKLLLRQTNPFHDKLKDDATCTMCHRVSVASDIAAVLGFSGHSGVETYENKLGRLIYGSAADIPAGPLRENIRYISNATVNIRESRICGNCHDLKTPFVDQSGTVISTPETEFHEQTVYTEWLASDYLNSMSCRDCHMCRNDGPATRSSSDGRAYNPRNSKELMFVGGNTLLIDLLMCNQEELGATTANMSDTLLRTEQMLQSAASVEEAGSSLQDDMLSFDLMLNSYTGHKLPTGIPLRRIILHVTVSDSQGNIVFESGRVNSDGSVAELDSDANLARFEPHYDVITSADQVQVYEAIMANSSGEVTYTLLRAADMLKDNRLLPGGFDKNGASANIRVAGLAGQDSNFVGGSDTISFQLNGMNDSSYSVQAELLFQPLSHAFLQDMNTEKTVEIKALNRMFQKSPAKTNGMTKAAFRIER